MLTSDRSAARMSQPAGSEAGRQRGGRSVEQAPILCCNTISSAPHSMHCSLANSNAAPQQHVCLVAMAALTCFACTTSARHAVVQRPSGHVEVVNRHPRCVRQRHLHCRRNRLPHARIAGSLFARVRHVVKPRWGLRLVEAVVDRHAAANKVDRSLQLLKVPSFPEV